MNDNDDAVYFDRRATEEDEAARTAQNPLAASIHRSLASRYRAKLRAVTIDAGVSKALD